MYKRQVVAGAALLLIIAAKAKPEPEGVITEAEVSEIPVGVTVDVYKRQTLESVVTRMGIPMERPFHDALSDTLYAADVCRKLDLRAGLAAYPTEEESLRASLCPAPGDYRDFRVFRGYVEPVSYTHLDVYKRQPLGDAGDAQCQRGSGDQGGDLL